LDNGLKLAAVLRRLDSSANYLNTVLLAGRLKKLSI